MWERPLALPEVVYATLVGFDSFLLTSSSFSRVFELPRTPATTAPIAKDARARAKLRLDSPFICLLTSCDCDSRVQLVFEVY